MTPEGQIDTPIPRAARPECNEMRRQQRTYTGNATVKAIMAAELLEGGLSADAVARILHLGTDEVQGIGREVVADDGKASKEA